MAIKTSRAWRSFIGKKVFVKNIDEEWNGKEYVDIALTGIIRDYRNYTDDCGRVDRYVSFDDVRMSSRWASHLDRRENMDGHSFNVSRLSFTYDDEELDDSQVKVNKLIDKIVKKVKLSNEEAFKDELLELIAKYKTEE